MIWIAVGPTPLSGPIFFARYFLRCATVSRADVRRYGFSSRTPADDGFTPTSCSEKEISSAATSSGGGC